MIQHLALPAKDLAKTKDFYTNFGCKFGRSSDKFLIMDFYGSQVVFHQDDLTPKVLKMYPRHFGLIVDTEDQLNGLYKIAKHHFMKFFEDKFIRYAGKTEEHTTFFLVDPSNNLLEFKWYKNREAIFT